MSEKTLKAVSAQLVVFFFKQKTAYDIRPRDWSSDVCSSDLDVVILAAGLGTRMKSRTIKILHRAAGRPIIDYVLDLAAEVCARPPVVIVGHQRESVQQHIGERARFAVQDPPRGTGHAAMMAEPLVPVRHRL